VPLLIGVITIPFIIRGLGTERFGLLSLAWVILGYFAIFDLGLGRATTKFIAEALGKGEKEKVPSLLWTSVTVIYPSLTGEVEVNWVSGCAMLIKSEVFDRIGFLKEKYFLYVDDTDFSWRATKAGWKLFVNLDAVIWHKGSASLGGQKSPLPLYYIARNWLYFINEELSGWQRWSCLMFFTLHRVLEIPKHIIRGRFMHLQYTFKGICDYLIGKTGAFGRTKEPYRNLPTQKKAALMCILPPTMAGGGERLAFYLQKLLEKKGYIVEVFCARDKPPRKRNILSSILAQLALLRSSYMIGETVKRRKDEFDLVISFDFLGWNYHDSGTRNFNIYTGGAYIHRRIFPLSDYIKFSYERYVFGTLARLSGKGKICIAPAERARIDLEKHRKVKCVVIENGIDTNHFRKLSNKYELREKYQLPKDSIVGLFVGRWGNVVKGTDTLLRLIYRKHDIHWLLVVGYGEMPEELKYIENVTILKEVKYEQLPEIYSLADFMFLPSRYEGFCYVAVEALACELPVIACPDVVPSIYDIYKDPDFKPLSLSSSENLEEVSLAISLLITDTRYRERIAKKAREKVVELCSIEVWESKMARVLFGEK